jgi:hypothetical protein
MPLCSRCTTVISPRIQQHFSLLQLTFTVSSPTYLTLFWCLESAAFHFSYHVSNLLPFHSSWMSFIYQFSLAIYYSTNISYSSIISGQYTMHITGYSTKVETPVCSALSLYGHFGYYKTKTKLSGLSPREETIPTKRPQLVSEVSTNVCG